MEEQGKTQEINQSFSQRRSPRVGDTRPWIIYFVFIFLLGIASGYLMWGNENPTESTEASSEEISPIVNDTQDELAEITHRINPPDGYSIPVAYGNIGPKLLEAGAIDIDLFIQVYRDSGSPLTEEQLDILTKGSDEPIVIGNQNAYFLLNFFWAFGLTNQNELLTEGPMMQYSDGEVGRFASTGGWTISAQPLEDIYSSTPIITLTKEQQERVFTVSSTVYRPCCNNPTHFPDCNHGMAMLGLLELMASQDASIEDMYEAAKYFNAFWFPQQTFEIALYFQASEGLSFSEIDAEQMVGYEYSSATGFNNVHDWLGSNGLLEQLPGGGSGCGV
jgi:hypothetical protein